MRFALKAAFEESLFLAAYYEDSKQAIWTDQLDDACDWSTLERVIGVKVKINQEVEIIPVTS
tara:strand:- start:133 stop:318 length:186 start_codon:yes stop_codon:yes gene_type:complete